MTNPSFFDPDHLRSFDIPCAWCGAKWVRTSHTTEGMDHSPDCLYILFHERLDSAALGN